MEPFTAVCRECKQVVPESEPFVMHLWGYLGRVAYCLACFRRQEVSEQWGPSLTWEEMCLRRCGECRRKFFVTDKRHRLYCSEFCYRQSYTEAARSVHLPRACEQCHGTFTPKRSDARFCSGRCRVAAHRASA